MSHRLLLAKARVVTDEVDKVIGAVCDEPTDRIADLAGAHWDLAFRKQHLGLLGEIMTDIGYLADLDFPDQSDPMWDRWE